MPPTPPIDLETRGGVGIELHADWLEMFALTRGSTVGVSVQDLTGALRRGGTIDASEDEVNTEGDVTPADQGAAATQGIAEDALTIAAGRIERCEHGTNVYPFVASAQDIKARNNASTKPYTFMLVLSQIGWLEAEGLLADGLDIFRDLAAVAARNYLGAGTATVSLLDADRATKVAYGQAIKNICQRLGEGGGYRDAGAGVSYRNAGLDLVAWHGFADNQPGKLIAFGQCHVRASWMDDLGQLQPRDFCLNWFQDEPVVRPLLFSFVPFAVHDIDRRQLGGNGGILFDRCRIAALAEHVSASLVQRMTGWTRRAQARLSA